MTYVHADKFVGCSLTMNQFLLRKKVGIEYHRNYHFLVSDDEYFMTVQKS